MRYQIRFAITLLALCGAACGKQDVEARARDAAEKIKASIPDVEARALAQHANQSDVLAAQTQLTKLNEYQGEIDGTLDAVTVNAIEAFQRTQGIEADGLLTDKVKRLLREAAAKVPATASERTKS